jgi:16S rRNA processing protein RimM
MTLQLLAVGRVLRPHGIRGELLLEPLTDFPERLNEVATVYLGEAAEPHALTQARMHRGQILIRLGDCADRDCAEAWRGQVVQIEAEAAAPLPPGRYYHHQIIGLTAVTDEGEALGPVVEILETGANDVYVVETAQGELLLPAIHSVVRAIEVDTGRLVVHLIEGLR